MKKLCKWISDYMGALVLVLSLVALVAPDVFSAFKPTIINPVLGIIMFGMGMALKIDDFKIVFSRPKDVIIGCLAQFTVMPLLVWLLAGQSVHVDVAGMLLSILWVVSCLSWPVSSSSGSGLGSPSAPPTICLPCRRWPSPSS